MNDRTDEIRVSRGRLDFSAAKKTNGIDHVLARIGRQHYCYLPAHKMKALVGADQEPLLTAWRVFRESWGQLGADNYMGDGGKYRKRRHAIYSANALGTQLHREPNQPHYQSLDYNHLNGGIARHYLPIENDTAANPVFVRLMTLCCSIFGQLRPDSHWHIEAHQFRIEAVGLSDAKPTPEGIHRDGVDFVLMLMVRRQNIVNGETGIYSRDGIRLDHFTLADEWDAAIVDDQMVQHGVTPIIQLDTNVPGIRDVLVITFRRK